jgi:Tol biopolymer transport system component
MAFLVVDQEHRMAHLFAVDVGTRATRTLTSGPFTVGSFEWSPDGTSIAFDHRLDPDPASGGSADISIVTVGDGAVRKLVTQEGPDSQPVWSPDGTRIAFETSMANPAFFYSNGLIATVPATGGAPTVLTAAFDEDPSIVAWKRNGLFFSASQRTFSPVPHRSGTRAVTPCPAETWVGSASRSRATGRGSRFSARTPGRCPRCSSRRRRSPIRRS